MKLRFEVLRVEAVKATAAHERYEDAKRRLRALRESKTSKESEMEAVDVEDRYVFHGCNPEIVPKICASTLRPSPCAQCKSGRRCADPGWFGLHTRGVYVSQHADYTFFYCKYAEVKAGDEGKTIVLKCVTGRRKYFSERVLLLRSRFSSDVC